MKKAEEVMEILEAYDLTGSLRAAARLAGCDHKTVAHSAALDFYEVGEVEALAGAVARDAHRWVPRLLDKLEDDSPSPAEAAAATRVARSAVVAESEVNPFFAQRLERAGVSEQLSVLATQWPPSDSSEWGVIVAPDELAARVQEDRRDADAFRLLLFTGLRQGEVLALRWADVELDDRLLLVRRAVSAGEKSDPKGRRQRFVPLSLSAVEALRRLDDREDFTGTDDYVPCNRLGRRLDPSALRRRYKAGCQAAGLRPVKLHGLRHAAGSLVARTNDAVFVRDFLGHAKLTTTDRYVSAKFRPEKLERLDRAFGIEPTVAHDRNV